MPDRWHHARMAWIRYAVAAAVGACGSAVPAPAPVATAVPRDAPPVAAAHVDDPRVVHAPPDVVAPRLPHLAPAGPVVVVQRGHDVEPTALAFDPRGGLLASAGGGRVIVWDTATHQARARFQPIGDSIRWMAYAPDDAWLALAGSSGVVVVDLRRATIAAPIACALPTGATATTIAWFDDHTLAMTCDGAIRIWDAAAGRERYAIRLDREEAAWQAPADAMASADGRRFVVRYGESTLEVRDVADGRLVARQALHDEVVQAIAWRPDRRALAVATEMRVRIVEPDGRTLAETAATQPHVLAFDPTGQRLAFDSAYAVDAWVWQDDRVEVIEDHGGGSGGLHWLAADRIVIGTEGTVAQGPPWHAVGRFACQGGCGDLATVTSPAAGLVANRDASDVVVWDALAGTPSPRLPAGGYAARLTRSVDGRLVVLGRRAIDLTTGATHRLAVDLEVVSPDARRIASLDRATGTLQIVDTMSSRVLAKRRIAIDRDDHLAFSGDGAFLVAEHLGTSKPGVLHVWRTRDLEKVRDLALPAAEFPSAAIVPRSSELIVTTLPAVIDLATGKMRHFAGPDRQVGWRVGLVISDDGKRFAFGNRVFETATLATIEDLAVGPQSFRPNSDDVAVTAMSTLGIHTRGGSMTRLTEGIGIPDSAIWSEDGSTLLSVGGNSVALWDAAKRTKIAELDLAASTMTHTRELFYVGARCVAYVDDDLHVRQVATGATLDVLDLDPSSPSGMAAMRDDGAVSAGAAALAKLRMRATPAVRGGALVAAATTAAGDDHLELVAEFVAHCN